MAFIAGRVTYNGSHLGQTPVTRFGPNWLLNAMLIDGLVIDGVAMID